MSTRTVSSDPGPLPSGFLPLRPQDPSAVGPFRLVGLLGEGGMGAVYGALGQGERHVAVKVVHDGFAGDDDYRERFAQEADLLARVDAECAPAFLGADPGAPRPWMATEFVPGRTLAGHVREVGTLDGDRLLSFAAGTAEALAAVHASGVVHRDVKPANVVLSPDGPRVLDFGIARRVDARDGERGVFGTPGWVAPERLDGAPGTPRADVFAWAGLVVHAATGHGPFGSGDTATLLARTREGRPELDGVPEDLRPLVERALSTDPEERPDALEAFREVLALTDTDPDAGLRTRIHDLLGRVWTGFDAVRGVGAWTAAVGGVGLLSASSAGGAAGAGAGAGAAGSAGAAGGAGAAGAAGGVLGGKTLAALTAATLVVGGAAGGYVGARLHQDQPLWPFAAQNAQEEAAPAEVDEDEDVELVEYRGAEFPVPDGWVAEELTDELQRADPTQGPVVEEWLLLYPEDDPECPEPEWRAGDPTSGCVHIKVAGPGALEHAGAGLGPISVETAAPGTAFAPTTDPNPCPEGQPVHTDNDPEFRGIDEWDVGEIDMGGRTADSAEGSALCMDPGIGDLAYYEQRFWIQEEAEILVVDLYGSDETDEMLADVRW